MSSVPRAGRVRTDTVWNIAGQVLPGLVALLCIPPLLHGLGAERFGALGLAWALIGYLGFLDLGLGRAVTRFAAEALGAGDTPRFLAIVWTGLGALLIVSVPLGLLFAAAGLLPGDAVLRFDDASVAAEAHRSLLPLALGIPFVLLSAGIRGALEAARQFRAVTEVRVPIAVLSFVGPVALLPFTRDVSWHVAVIALARAAGMFAFAARAFRVHPGLWAARAQPDRAALKQMLGFGSWLTVSSLVSPLMVTLDRFVVGAMVSMSAVAAYVTPFEAASRLLILPASLGAALFPRFSAASGAGSLGAGAAPEATYREAIKRLSLIMVPVVVIGIVLSEWALRFWVGEPLASDALSPLRWLLVGVLFNGLAQVPLAWLQGIGRADLTAKAHLVEAPIHLALLFVLTRSFGVTGTAIAWTARAALDFGILVVMRERLRRHLSSATAEAHA